MLFDGNKKKKKEKIRFYKLKKPILNTAKIIQSENRETEHRTETICTVLYIFSLCCLAFLIKPQMHASLKGWEPVFQIQSFMIAQTLLQFNNLKFGDYLLKFENDDDDFDSA